MINFFPDMECVGTYSDAESFLKRTDQKNLDVVLMDIGLPGMNGIDCIRSADKEGHPTEYLIYTDHLDSREIFDALAAGANGYVSKGDAPEKLAEAIRDIHRGGSPMSRQISRMVADSFKKNE